MRLDLYLNESLLSSSRKINIGQSRIASYIANANLTQYKGRTYDDYLDECATSILFAEDLPTDFDKKPFADTVWTEADTKNMNYVVQSIGYDCFDDSSYSQENKKYLYNTLSDYLSDDVLEDQHKLQSTISMVKTLYSVRALTG